MPKPTESSYERRARRVYKELGLETAAKREKLLRELGVKNTLQEQPPAPVIKIRFSPNSAFDDGSDA